MPYLRIDVLATFHGLLCVGFLKDAHRQTKPELERTGYWGLTGGMPEYSRS